MASSPSFDVAILGGGQLGRMMIEAAHRIGVTAKALDPAGPASPAGQVIEGGGVPGSFRDPDAVAAIAAGASVVTVEIEHVDTESLKKLEAEGRSVHPSADTIAVIQDKYAQKCFLDAAGVAVGPFMDTPNLEDARAAGEKFGYPFMLKAKRMAYDGKGNAVVATAGDLEAAFASLGGDKANELYAEQWVSFSKELAIMVARSVTGEVVPYPVVETEQRDNVCHTVLAPAQEPANVLAEATEVATRAIGSLGGAGIFGVEMFLCTDGTVLLNEIAPRPHNSGHYTMEACETDQFEQHLRCVLGLPLGSSAMRVGAACMVNFLGKETGADTLAEVKRCLAVPGAGVHWYGKAETRKGRKMGHVTVVADDMAMLDARLKRLEAVADMSITLRPSPSPVVGIIMGSDSDLPCMQAAAAVLDELEVPYELTIVSAHRTPDRMYQYARAAAGRGIRNIIAGAGGAAHLPGMVAALTPLPVIGVPVKSSTLSGVDSLYSIVQMPRGIPVATVAIGNAKNAGLLSARMLAAHDAALQARLVAWQESQTEEVLDKADRLESEGYKAYLGHM